MEPVRAVKGMNDVLPAEMPAWHLVEERFRALAEAYSYREVRTPVVEPTALFARSIGETTDIVEKEMYSFVDKGDEALTLRPEGTASSVRAYIQHSAWAEGPVTRWYYLGPMYRRERPQKGRYRQFYQLGVEVYGDPGPHVDAEMIDMAVRLLEGLGIRRVTVELNSLGGPGTRVAYRDALSGFLSPSREALCPDCRRRLEHNPLRVLDCKVPTCRQIAAGAPRITDHLTAEDRSHLDGLRRMLDRLGTPHVLEPRLVRGLDYYTRTLFEIKEEGGELGSQNTLVGGGRYDGLVESLGGPPTAAIGFAAGIERLVLSLPDGSANPIRPAVSVVSTGSATLDPAVVAARDLRLGGIATDIDTRGSSLKSQLRRSDKLGARFALIVGEDELSRGRAALRDLGTKEQVEVPLSKPEIVDAVRTAMEKTT
ncbi:MAG: histidine--tRNA ligase [Deltaproteobacteria bacterium]|nr:histidine--tRNA ligase [Deltaproteobacteria bacterium]